MTYGRHGVAKPGVFKSHHAIIYTSRKAPNPQPNELPVEGENGMLKAIRVEPHSRQEKLDSLSRINFSKIYTVEHNVKVYDFGDVHKYHIRDLRHQWRDVLDLQLQTPAREDDPASRAAQSAFPAETIPSPAAWPNATVAQQSNNKDDEGNHDDDDDDDEEEEQEFRRGGRSVYQGFLDRRHQTTLKKSVARDTSDARAERSYDRTLENTIEKNAREFDKAPGNDEGTGAKKARIFSAAFGKKRVKRTDSVPDPVSQAAPAFPKSSPLSHVEILQEQIAPTSHEDNMERGETAAPSDSGYASRTHAKLEQLKIYQTTSHMEAAQSAYLGPTQSDGYHDTNQLSENVDDVPADEYDDTRTLYSDTSSVAPVK
jgi:hypothetical protein